MHMAPIHKLTAEEKATMELLPEPIPVTTANGIAYVTHTALIVVPDLRIRVMAYLSENTPFLLSAGQLCNECCDFTWRRGRDPLIQVYDEENRLVSSKTLVCK